MGEDFHHAHPSELIGFWANILATLLRSELDEQLRPLGLSATEGILLTMLHFKGPVPLVKLSTHMALAHPSVLRHIDSLETQGFLERTPHPTDRRSKLVGLTSAGRELEKKVHRIVLKVNAQATRQVSEAEKKRMIELMYRVINNLGGLPMPVEDLGLSSDADPTPSTRASSQDDSMETGS